MRHSLLTNEPRDVSPSAAVRCAVAVLRGVRDALVLLRQSVLPAIDASVAGPTADHGRDTPPSSRLRLMGAWLVRRAMVTFAALILLCCLMTIIVRHVYDDRIYPAVVIGDVPVGSLTAGEARMQVAARVKDLEHGLITFADGDQVWTPSLSDLGATIRVEEVVADAYAAGRSGRAVDRVVLPGGLLAADRTVPIRVDIDAHRLDAWFDRVDRDLGQPPRNARIMVDGQAVTIIAGASGRVVDRQAARAQIERAVSGLAAVTVALPTITLLPAIQGGELEPTRARLAQVVATPVLAAFDDRTWTIDGAVVGPYLEVTSDTNSETPTFEIGFDLEALAAGLRREYSDQINRPPVDAVLGWEGAVVVRAPASTGITFDATAFAEAVAASFLASHAPVDVPVVITAPQIDGADLDALGIETVLARGDSNFSDGDEGRDANVQVAASYLSGSLVAPGAVFSFNQAIGEISYERGYVGALVAGADGVISDAGGGACQVSTTVFRAALDAGLPIVERYAHTVRLPNYELDGWSPGFDASILQEGSDPEQWPDFKFRNDTPGWLLIEAAVAYPHVDVTIYGSSDGRSVSLEWATLGTNAFAVRRVVVDADGTLVVDETFASYYEG